MDKFIVVFYFLQIKNIVFILNVKRAERINMLRTILQISRIICILFQLLTHVFIWMLSQGHHETFVCYLKDIIIYILAYTKNIINHLNVISGHITSFVYCSKTVCKLYPRISYTAGWYMFQMTA